MSQRFALAADAHRDRTVIVLGGTSGIGLAAVSSLAAAGATVLLVARDAGRARTALATLGDRAARVHTIDGDASSMASIRSAVAAIDARATSVDAVLCNAAIPEWRESSRGRTDEGRNRIFASNYLGHYLLVRLLRSRLEAARGRAVFIAGPQRFYRGAPALDDLDYRRPGAERSAYAGAKIACFCLAAELARRSPSVLTAMIDPGLVATEFQRDSPWPLRAMLALGLFRNTVEDVGALYAWLALDPLPRRALDERGENLRFASPRGERTLERSRDELVFGRERLGLAYQSALWEASARIVGLDSPQGDEGAR